MTKSNQRKQGKQLGFFATLAAGLLFAGCSDSQHDHEQDHGPSSTPRSTNTIINLGSYTMLNLATAWAQAYAIVAPSVSVEVKEGGSGLGIAALISGSCDIANCSRQIKEKEIADFKSKHPGKEPKEFLVAYDALSVFVNKDNPLEQISVEELQQLYRKDGKISKWSELGVPNIPGAKSNEVMLIGREETSGPNQYFREAIVGETNEMRPGIMELDASKAVELVATTPNAIGYSRMDPATPRVKHLKISWRKGEKAVESLTAKPSDNNYPISRPLIMYTAGEPPAYIKKYLDWILSDAGQKLVEPAGYVPVPKP